MLVENFWPFRSSSGKTRAWKGYAWWLKLVAVGLIFGVAGAIFLYWEIQFRAVKNSTMATTVGERSYFLDSRILNLVATNTTAVRSYCYIRQCEVIVCSGIPSNLDAGNYISNYINSTLKEDQCGIKSAQLEIQNCRFPSNKLHPDWLQVDFAIEKLTLRSCLLQSIDTNSFASSVYSKLSHLSIIENNITAVERKIFQNLPSLKYLLIQNNWIWTVEFDLLADLDNTLESLEIRAAMKSEKILRNITGGKPLNSLQILVIEDNVIPFINHETFIGIPNIRSAHIEKNQIKILESNTFDVISRSLEQLFVRNNDIATLPEGIFDSFLQLNKTFVAHIDSNPFNCDCNLLWLKKLIKDHPKMINEVPTCYTPSNISSQFITVAEFCNEISTNTPNSSTPITTLDDTVTVTEASTTTSANQIKITCDYSKNSLIQEFNLMGYQYGRKLLSGAEYEFRLKFVNFSLIEHYNGTIKVILPEISGILTLLWFNNRAMNYEFDSIEREIHCIRNVKYSYLMENLETDSAYTICLMDDRLNFFSPLNCLAATTQPKISARAWLVNGDKTITLLLLFVVILIIFFSAIVSTFFILRKHPVLLCGSERIVMVKHRKLDAIVLPEKIRINADSTDKCTSIPTIPPFNEPPKVPEKVECKEQEYIVPLPPNREISRKDSRTSRTSVQSNGTSYISEIEPTLVQLASWRLNRMKSEICSEPPPLPPHPKCVITSVSMSVDSNNDDLCVSN